MFAKRLLCLFLICAKLFNHAALPPEVVPAAKPKNAPSLKFITAYPIANQLAECRELIKKLEKCQKLQNNLEKLPAELQYYTLELQTLIERYKQFHSNGKLEEDPTQALFNAVEYGLADLLPDLILLGANINGQWQLQLQSRALQDSFTPLMAAAIRLLVINRATSEFTFRAYLIKEDDTIIIDRLIDLGAQINAHSPRHGFTPLHWALWAENFFAILTLINRGASVISKSNKMVTPLHLLASHVTEYYWAKKILPLFLEKGADINAQDIDGETPLMWATDQNNPTMVSLLMQYGANTTITDNQGRTALQIAQQKGFDKIVKLLEHYDATQMNLE